MGRESMDLGVRFPEGAMTGEKGDRAATLAAALDRLTESESLPMKYPAWLEAAWRNWKRSKEELWRQA